MVSVSSFKSSSTQHDVHFVNYGPIYFKIDHKAGYALGRGYLVIDRSLPQQTITSCSVFVCINRHCKALWLPKHFFSLLKTLAWRFVWVWLLWYGIHTEIKNDGTGQHEAEYLFCPCSELRECWNTEGSSELISPTFFNSGKKCPALRNSRGKHVQSLVTLLAFIAERTVNTRCSCCKTLKKHAGLGIKCFGGHTESAARY